MLLLVLILVLVAFGLLVVALLTGNVLCAWLSVAVSVAAAVVLIVDWLQRRSAVKAGRAGADVAPAVPESPAADLDPVTEVLPVVPATGDDAGSTAETRFDAPRDSQRTVVMPAVQPSGSTARPSGAEGGATPSGGSSSPSVTERRPQSPAGEDARSRSDEPDGDRADTRRGDAEATVVVDIRKAGGDTGKGGPAAESGPRPESASPGVGGAAKGDDAAGQGSMPGATATSTGVTAAGAGAVAAGGAVTSSTGGAARPPGERVPDATEQVVPAGEARPSGPGDSPSESATARVAAERGASGAAATGSATTSDAADTQVVDMGKAADLSSGRTPGGGPTDGPVADARPTGEGPTAAGLGRDRAAGDRLGDRPADADPAGDRPAAERPADAGLGRDRAAGDRSADTRPADSRFADTRPARDRPADARPANGRTGERPGAPDDASATQVLGGAGRSGVVGQPPADSAGEPSASTPPPSGADGAPSGWSPPTAEPSSAPSDQTVRATFGGAVTGPAHELFDPVDRPAESGRPPSVETTTAMGAAGGGPTQQIDDEEPPEEPLDTAVARIVATLTDEVIVVDEQPRYHVQGCRGLLNQPVIALPAREAVELGFTPCGWCTPDAVLGARHKASARP